MSPQDVTDQSANDDRQDVTAYATGNLTFAELSERALKRYCSSSTTPEVNADPVAVYDAARTAATSLMGSYAWLANNAESSDEAERWWAAYSVVYRERAQIDARDQQGQLDAFAAFKAREKAVQSVEMPPTSAPLGESQIQGLFNKAALRTLFAEGGNESNPVAVLIGGQPGAGKTRAIQFACELYNRRVVIVSGHDFQALHPNYKHFQKQADEDVFSQTHELVEALVTKSIAYAKEHRISVLVEETFTDVDTVMSTADGFANEGFDVHAVALAVPPSVSGASAMGKYYESQESGSTGWSPDAAHRSALQGLPTSLEALGASHLVRRVTVISRDGEILFDTRESGDGAALEVLMHVANAQRQELSDQEQAMVDEVQRRAEGLKSRGA